jgi:PAS domain S-box-containing protein
MNQPSRELLAAYTAALREYLEGGGEITLQRAYELGRRALRDGIGVLEMATLHRLAMGTLASSAPQPLRETIAVAGQFFAESLSSFEMSHRGFQEANAALQASERRYRELVENANDVVYTADLAGTFTSFNRAAEELTGYRREEVGTKTVADVVAPEYLGIVRDNLERKLSGESDRTRYEVEIVRKDGCRVPVEVHSALIYEEGRPVGVHGIARDMTDRKQAEQALRRLNERMEDEAKRIAHALHDEVSQLLGSVHLAIAECAQELPENKRKHLHPVKQLLGEIEDQIRGLSRELRPTVLDDLGLLPALEFLADGISKRNGIMITVRGSVSEQLPPAAATTLYRVAQEALTNVMRHAHATCAFVEVVQESDAIRCSIRDDGVGFDVPEILSRRGERGLGLIGIRERVSALGGFLAIHSTPGQGTELVVTIRSP